MTDVAASSYRPRNNTADRALEILMLFSAERPRLSANDITEALGVSKSTIYRYLQSLIATGFLEEDHNAQFQLGQRVLELAHVARRNYGLSDIAKPRMRELAQEVGETVLLTRWSRLGVVCLEREDAPNRGGVRISYDPGHYFPPNAGAGAIASLAWLPDDQVHQVLRAPFPAFTSQSMVDPAELMRRFAEVRRAGYAVSHGEIDDDVFGVAAPIFGAGGAPVGAIAIVGLSSRFDEQRELDLVDRVKEFAREISETLDIVD